MRERGLNQEQLAERTRLPRTQVNGYVTGRLRLGRKNAERFAAALGDVEPATLVTARRVAMSEEVNRQAEDVLAQLAAAAERLSATAEELSALLAEQREVVEQLLAAATALTRPEAANQGE